MSKKIYWYNLLNEKRPKDKKSFKNDHYDKKKLEAAEQLYEDHRNQFDRDYDRVVASSSLRRLQDKAQVFPLQESDFIRTRLTHSIEVSSIARSLGNWLEKWLIEHKRILTEKDRGKIPTILAVAGLVHDIGNPPFGHYGEDVIKSWFQRWYQCFYKEGAMNISENTDELFGLEDAKEKFRTKYGISQAEMNDFLHFDGNAQGMRVLTRLQFLNDQYGMNFTYGTLSVLLKYPWGSSYSKAIKDKKFGFFQQDKEMVQEIIQETVKLKNTRNPLTYLLEAADDIAYLGADVEDGVKKKLIHWDEVFSKHIDSEDGVIGGVAEYREDIETLKEKHRRAKQNSYPDYELTSVQNFKVWAQGQMIREVKQVFMSHYDEIMNGTFGDNGYKDLLDASVNGKRIRDFFNKELLRKHVFCSKEVLSLELVGDSVINELLDVFIKECITQENNFESDTRCKAGKIFSMISNNFVFVHTMNQDINNPKKDKNVSDLSTYQKLLLITDFISGMTDSYALDLHQKLKGVKMP